MDEYLIDLNATQAAIRVGYSPKTARAIGAENLTKPAVQKAIQEAMQARQERTQVTQDEIVQYWAKIMRANMTDYTTWGENGGIRLKPSTEVDGMVIQSVSESRNGSKVTKEVRLKDGMRASENLAKHLGMFIDKHELNAKVGPMEVILNVPEPQMKQ